MDAKELDRIRKEMYQPRAEKATIVEEIYRRYGAGERNFPGVDLSHADLNVALVALWKGE